MSVCLGLSIEGGLKKVDLWVFLWFRVVLGFVLIVGFIWFIMVGWLLLWLWCGCLVVFVLDMGDLIL